MSVLVAPPYTTFVLLAPPYTVSPFAEDVFEDAVAEAAMVFGAATSIATSVPL